MTVSTNLTVKTADPIVTNLANLPDGEIGAVASTAWIPEEVREIESKGIVGELPVVRIVTNPHNPRLGNWQADCDDLYAEIARVGFDKSQPLTVLLNVGVLPDAIPGGDDAIATALRGNRRLTVLQKMAEKDPVLFRTILPSGTVPVVMFSGLSEREVAILTVDHGVGKRRKELNAAELLVAVRLLVKTGTASQADIGKHFGKSRSWAQKMIALTKMPAYVREAFMPVLLGKLDATKLRNNDILFVARDFTNLSAEAFAASWSQFTGGTHPDGEYKKSVKNGAAGSVKPVDIAAIRERAETFDSETFKGIVKSHDGDGFAVAVDNTIKRLEAEIADLSNQPAVTDESVLRDAENYRLLLAGSTPKQCADYAARIEKARAAK